VNLATSVGAGDRVPCDLSVPLKPCHGEQRGDVCTNTVLKGPNRTAWASQQWHPASQSIEKRWTLGGMGLPMPSGPVLVAKHGQGDWCENRVRGGLAGHRSSASRGRFRSCRLWRYYDARAGGRTHGQAHGTRNMGKAHGTRRIKPCQENASERLALCIKGHRKAGDVGWHGLAHAFLAGPCGQARPRRFVREQGSRGACRSPQFGQPGAVPKLPFAAVQ
jgi:hypothetical protein